MKSTLIVLIVFSCFSQNCYCNSNEIDHMKNESAPNEFCKVCEEVTGHIISLRKSNANRAAMYDYLIDLCINSTDYGSIVCMGEVELKLDTALYIIDHRKNVTPARFCAIQYQSAGCVDPDAEAWSIPVPTKQTSFKPEQTSKNTTEVVRILHVTDIHYDPLYNYSSNANCKEPLCCEQGWAATKEEAAGYWGDYHVCDTPWSAIQNLFFNLKGRHVNLDWIYFTGDIVSHRSWATSIKNNSESISEILQMFATTFPALKVYPILGNHESHPADHFSPDTIDKRLNISTQWLYNLSAKEWLRWLPATTEATIRKGGFYTVLVKPGFRIIALNSNVCFTSNLWLTYDDKDPYGQLQWLVDVLIEAETNGEKVHILSHIPPGELSCHRQWSHEFKKIVLRFSDTIVAQFNGHTHYDEFKLFFNSSTLDEVKAIAYNGASFATFVGSNPNYRIYEVGNETMAVTNFDQYTFNMTKANINPRIAPVWYKLYSFKEAYGLPDLQLESLGDLFWQLASNNSDNELVDKKYYRYRFRESDVSLKKECDGSCKKTLVCLIASSEFDESINC